MYKLQDADSINFAFSMILKEKVQENNYETRDLWQAKSPWTHGPLFLTSADRRKQVNIITTRKSPKGTTHSTIRNAPPPLPQPDAASSIFSTADAGPNRANRPFYVSSTPVARRHDVYHNKPTGRGAPTFT